MKAKYKHIALALFCLLSLKSIAQTFTIPDQEFLKFLQQNHSTLLDNSNNLILSRAATFSDSLRPRNLGIQSIEGIQYFHAIRGINVSGNQITNLPNIGKLASLQTLNVRNNRLTSLPNLDSLTNLTNIYADYNQLASLPNLDKNEKLLSIQVSYNNLLELPALTNQVKVNIIDVSNNQLTSLPSLSAVISLERLICANNKLTSLPSLATLNNLKRLNVSNNLFTQLPNMSTHISLNELVAEGNLLTEAPDLKLLTNLTKVQIQNNFLTFDDLYKYVSHPNFALAFDYSPQRSSSVKRKLTVSENTSVTLDLGYSDTVSGLVYSWYKNTTLLAKISEDQYLISPIKVGDVGSYSSRVTHPDLSKLTLYTDTIELEVTPDPIQVLCPNIKDAAVTMRPARCTELGEIQLHFEAKFQDSIKFDLKDSNGTTVQPMSKLWYTGLKSGEYMLTIRPSDFRCVGVHTQKIVLKMDRCNEVVLTPNNDGKDDTLYLTQRGMATVIDKNGKIVKTLAIPAEWDGTNNDGILPQGYYLIRINGGSEYFNVSIIY